ncbi:pimeloyl-[acyl-carrier protein] methyl ester esterase, partial [Pseudoalteromonas sp. S185]
DDIKQLKQLLTQYSAPNNAALAAGLAILQNDELRELFATCPVKIMGIFGRLDALVPYKALAIMSVLNSEFDYQVID